MAEVLLKGPNLWNEGNFQLAFQLFVDSGGLAFWLLQEQVFEQVRTWTDNGQMSHCEKCSVVGLIHFSGPSFDFFLESVQISISVHLDTETEFSDCCSVFWKLLHHFSVLSIRILFGRKLVFVLFGKQGAAFFWSLALGKNSFSVADGICLFGVELFGSLSWVFSFIFFHLFFEEGLSSCLGFCLPPFEPSDFFEIAQKLLSEGDRFWDLEQFFVYHFENVQGFGIFVTELHLTGF